MKENQQLHNMADTVTPAVAFGQDDYLQPPQATVCLSETTLEGGETPSRAESPSVKPESEDGQDEKKAPKKRKSWGQELPTPKTNLPPRHVYHSWFHQYLC